MTEVSGSLGYGGVDRSQRLHLPDGPVGQRDARGDLAVVHRGGHRAAGIVVDGPAVGAHRRGAHDGEAPVAALHANAESHVADRMAGQMDRARLAVDQQLKLDCRRCIIDRQLQSLDRERLRLVDWEHSVLISGRSHPHAQHDRCQYRQTDPQACVPLLDILTHRLDPRTSRATGGVIRLPTAKTCRLLTVVGGQITGRIGSGGGPKYRIWDADLDALVEEPNVRCRARGSPAKHHSAEDLISRGPSS